MDDMTAEINQPERRQPDYVYPNSEQLSEAGSERSSASIEAAQAKPAEVRHEPKTSEAQVKKQIDASPKVKEFLESSGQMQSMILENMLNGKISIFQLEEKLKRQELSAAELNDILFPPNEIQDSPHMLQ